MIRALFSVLTLLTLLTSQGATAAPRLTIAIIGTGDMGDSLGPSLARLGYPIVYGSRKPDSKKARALVQLTGHGAIVATQREAAQQGDIVITAVPWPPMEKVAQSLGDLTGKVVVDISMPFEQAADGYPRKLLETSSAEVIQGLNPGARVVKAWATVGAQVIGRPEAFEGPVTVPLASDDRAAKETIAEVVAAMGLDPVDFGPLRMAREIESLQMVYMIPLVQRREQSWEFYFRRSSHWWCQPGSDEWYAPVFDQNDLATWPGRPAEDGPCVGQ
jgi:predicted dinucleotide-binding enzyme